MRLISHSPDATFDVSVYWDLEGVTETKIKLIKSRPLPLNATVILYVDNVMRSQKLSLSQTKHTSRLVWWNGRS